MPIGLYITNVSCLIDNTNGLYNLKIFKGMNIRLFCFQIGPMFEKKTSKWGQYFTLSVSSIMSYIFFVAYIFLSSFKEQIFIVRPILSREQARLTDY